MTASRRAFAGLCLAFVLTGPAILTSPAAAQTRAGDPGQFINGLGQQVIRLISDKQQPAQQRKQRFGSIVENAFDTPAIARFILGPYWRSASGQQRADFEQVFKTYMIGVYWNNFSQYSGQQFNVTGQHSENATTTIVNSEIVQSGGKPPVKVDWRVATTSGNNKITDVSVAGVSELITYRQEFGNVIAQAGGNVDSLTAQLRQKVQQFGGA